SLPIQILVGSKDHLVPKESTLAIQKLNQKSEFTIREVKVGHIGLSVSQKSHQNLWPQVLEWLE
ncbi:MAG: class III poly(R)-hydroxyalkanoic acid synthase subunit PhaC, partial [Planctomycetota bacterium]